VSGAWDWDCTAYGPEGREFGAMCFLAADLGKRVCTSQDACREAMGAERRRVYQRINELAAHGNPDMADLAEVFTDPGQILGGEE